MKITITAFVFASLLVVFEAMGLAIVQASGSAPPLIEYWGPLSAIGVGLVAYGTLRATLAAHKEYTASALAEKASKDELSGLVRLIESMHEDLRALRELVEDRLTA